MIYPNKEKKIGKHWKEEHRSIWKNSHLKCGEYKPASPRSSANLKEDRKEKKKSNIGVLKWNFMEKNNY